MHKCFNTLNNEAQNRIVTSKEYIDLFSKLNTEAKNRSITFDEYNILKNTFKDNN